MVEDFCLHFVKSATSLKYNKVKDDKTRYACINNSSSKDARKVWYGQRTREEGDYNVLNT